MTPVRRRVLLAVLAAATMFAVGVVIRFFAQAPALTASEPLKAPVKIVEQSRLEAASSGQIGSGLAAPFLRGLRGRLSPAAPQPPPASGGAPSDTMTLTENPEPMLREPALVARDAPLPPRRPPDLAATLDRDIPAPPVRPTELADAQAVSPQAALAGLAASAQVPVNAPLPPTRPRIIAALEAAPAPTQEAKLESPSVTTAPQPQAPAEVNSAPVQQIAAHSEPALRPAPEGSFNQPDQPPARFNMGAPVYIRIFKKEGELELWLKHNGRYMLYRSFPICKWSGRLGPKLKEADYQSPEGFYSVSARQLNPKSNYHRAFNVGYPNAYDRQNGRTGGLVMVHGACKSVGCFAMTDKGIDEIYGFVAAALAGGQHEVPVHIFPFRMTDAAIARESSSGGGALLSFLATENADGAQWASFWRNLKEGYDMFQQTGEPPVAYACGDHYAFGDAGAACKRVAGW